VFTNEVVGVDDDGPVFLDACGFECRVDAPNFIRPLLRPRAERWWRSDVAPWLRLSAIERGEAPARNGGIRGASTPEQEDEYEVVRSEDLRTQDIVMPIRPGWFGYTVVTASEDGVLLRDYDDQLCTIEVSLYLREMNP
jgi:hypothetical protein